MVGSSKILTVSYGTFSCTLEGFDDSFSTMKAIAEYFRDLASDDRYFGAEPPTPDAEMLARIAEREVSRRVEARLDDGNFILKTGSALAVDSHVAQEPETNVAQQASQADTAASGRLNDAESDAAQTAPMPVMPPVARAPQAAPASAFAPTAPSAEDDYEEDEPTATAVEAPLVNLAPVAPSGHHADANSVAAKLQRIRAVVGRGVDTPEVEDGSQAPQSLFAAPPEDARETPAQEPAETQAAADDIEDINDGAISEAVHAEDDLDGDDHDDTLANLIAAQTDAYTETADEVADDAEAEFFSELDDEDDAELDQEATTLLDDHLEDDVTTDDIMDVAPESAPESAQVSAQVSAQDAAQDATTAATEDLPEDLAQDVAQSDTPAPAAPAPVRARVIRMRRSEVDAAVATGSLVEKATQEADIEVSDATAPEGDAVAASLDVAEDIADFDISDLNFDDLGQSAQVDAAQEDAADLARMDGVDLASDTAFDDEEDSTLTAEAEADLQAELAALVGGMETEDDAVVHNDTLLLDAEDILGDDIDDDIDEDIVDTASALAQEAAQDISDDIDIDLQDIAEDLAAPLMLDADTIVDDMAEATANTLDDVTEELATSEDDVSDDDTAPAAGLRPRRVRMPGSIDEDPEAMSRIMSQTEAQMSEPDSSRRREAIAQLKAAVVATEADRDAGAARPADAGDDEDVFRDDLRQAVRPTRPIRPQRPAERTERPVMAPLKLVASQRVDVAAQDGATPAHVTPVRPVRPRRVSAAETAAPLDGMDTSSSAGFADFAAEMGASNLSDLLEAAAAYTSFVEGSEDFSRPQLMSKVQEMSAQEYSREEGLRSFGTLLRQGRIMKVRNGRFQVSDETRFNPERRAG